MIPSRRKVVVFSLILVGSVAFASAQQVEQTQEPNVFVEEDQVTTTVYLENTGEDMEEKWLIEQDPRLQEENDPWFGIFSFTGEQQTCDPDNPEIVHKDYQLDSGESTKIKLQSRNLEPGTYDLKLVSATGCTTGETKEENVVSTEPFGWRTIIEEFKIEGETPNINAYRQPSLNINNETGEVTGTVFFENNGSADMEREFIVEMQIRTGSGELLSTIGRQGTCDPSHPENVHKTFSLDAGDRKSITLESEVPEAGIYDIEFVTASECMTDGEGVFVQPYVAGVSDFTFDDLAIGKDGENPPEEPPIPQGMLVLFAGSLILIGGGMVLYRRDILG